MTDSELKRRKAICEVAKVNDIGEVSDGFHTFNSLYEQRMILFAALVKAYRDKAWKSRRHEDGEYCFGGGWFIVGIDTPEGSYTYHYGNRYWGMFDCVELPRGKHWDGHTEKDAEARLMSLEPRPRGKWIDHTDEGYVECPFCGSATNCDGDISELHYCFSCGADMSSDWFTTQNFGPEEISAEDARRILTEWREQNEH